jgi:pilus assembly protein CpaD
MLRVCAGLMSMLVAACANPVNGPEDGQPYDERFPITVEPQIQILRVEVDAAGLGPDSTASLGQFARDYLRNGSGSLRVSAPRRLPQAANLVADRLADFGIPRDRIMTGLDDVPNAADEVKITYIGYQAHAEPCGDWSSNLGDTAANKTSPNFGCATQHNLAAMIADPRDLATPKPFAPGDAQRGLTVLDKYRKGEPTPTNKTAEQSGAVSKAVADGGGGGK